MAPFFSVEFWAVCGTNVVIAAVHVYPAVTRQHQTLIVERFAHFSLIAMITSYVEEFAPA